MKQRRKGIAMLLSLCVMLALCACGGGSTPAQPTEAPAAAETPAPTPEATESPLAAYAGEYRFHCAYMGPKYMDQLFAERGVKARDVGKYYVAPDLMREYTITLYEDGTGYLFWGEENQGPIDWWTVDGDALQFQAGVTTFDGSLADGYMKLVNEEDFELYFASPEGLVPDVETIGMEDYVAMLYGTGDAEAASEDEEIEVEIEGVYYCYALENEGYRVRLDDFAQSQDGAITFNEDGTAVMITGDVENRFTWRVEDGRMVWYDESGQFSMDGLMTVVFLSDGVFTLQQSGQAILSYYAKADADVSGIETISVEEYRAAAGQ